MKNKKRGYNEGRDFNIPSRENVRKGDILYEKGENEKLNPLIIEELTEYSVNAIREDRRQICSCPYNQAIILQTNTGNGTRLLVGKNADKSLLETVLHSLDTNSIK